MSARTIAAALLLIERELRDTDRPDNYQRGALEKAQECLQNHDIPGAVHTLGDAIDHAHRPGWTETRREVAVCVEAFRLLTAGANNAGSAA